MKQTETERSQPKFEPRPPAPQASILPKSYLDSLPSSISEPLLSVLLRMYIGKIDKKKYIFIKIKEQWLDSG